MDILSGRLLLKYNILDRKSKQAKYIDKLGFCRLALSVCEKYQLDAHVTHKF